MRRTKRRITRLITILVLLSVGGVLATVFHSLLPTGLADALEIDRGRIETIWDNVQRETNPPTKSTIATIDIGTIFPQEEFSCIAASCTSNRLEVPRSQTLEFHVEVTPQNVQVDTEYVAVIRAPNGSILDSKNIRWAPQDLTMPSDNDRSQRNIQEAERRRIKSLWLGVNPDDKSIPAFVSEYNASYNVELDKYEDKLLKDIESLPEIFDFRIPRSVGPEPFTFNPKTRRTIIDRHYTFEVLSVPDFIKELDPRLSSR